MEKHKDELLTAQQVADLLNYSVKYFQATIAKLEDFPRALVFGKGPKAQRRWYKSEVLEYVEGSREDAA